MNISTLERFNSAVGAANYRTKFERQRVERIKDRSEQRLVRAILEGLPKSELKKPVLDLPCGYGRFGPALRELSSRVFQSDWSYHMLRSARRELGEIEHGDFPTGYVRANALELPFADNAFDLVFSVRLCHHLPTREERVFYLREILRISNKWVVLTYLDEYSLHSIIRGLKRRSLGKRPKWTMTRRQVAGLADEAGFSVDHSVPLSRLFSGQRYTLLRRVKAAPSVAVNAVEKVLCNQRQAALASIDLPTVAMEATQNVGCGTRGESVKKMAG